MSPLLENTGFQIFDRIVLSPLVESALILGVFWVVRLITSKLTGAATGTWFSFPMVVAALAYLTHGGGSGDAGSGLVAAFAFVCFSYQLLWMRPRYGWGLTYYGLCISHIFANVITLFFMD
jgi:hypothetical protein